MGKVRLGKVLIEQKESVGTADGNNLTLIGVNNREGLHLSKYKRISNVSRYKLLKKNWFAYNPMRINVGSIGFAHSDKETGIISPDYVVFSCSEMIDPEYFFHFIKSKAGLIEISKNTGGSVRERLYFQNLAKIEIELPAFKDQKRIAASLNKKKELMEQLYKESRYLERDLSLLRNCILQQAVQGKLTKQSKDDEPADKLLQRIKAEKQKLIAAGKLKKEKELPPITEKEIPFELPKGWVWCRLGEVGEINPRNDFDDKKEASFIPMTLISAGFGEVPKFEKRKWKDIKNGFTHFAENDVAVAKITPCFENSKAGIFTGLVNGIGAGTTELHIFRQVNKAIFSEYVYMFFKSPNFLKEGESKMTGSAGQKRVPSDYIRSCLFPLAPTAEQHRIITKVQHLMIMVNQLEQQVAQSQTQTEQLLQAVLKEAFSAGFDKVLEKA
jgi:restriction endonuclease S subunit